MSSISIQGGVPLTGSVQISGAKNSSLKLVHAAMFSNDDVYLENVPKIQNIENDMSVVQSIGGHAEWVGPNRLLLNGSGINTHIVPFELGSKYRTCTLLAAPLLYRFGKASIPLPGGCKIGPRPINRWIEFWKAQGIDVTIDETYVHLVSSNIKETSFRFKTNTHMGTDNALISAAFTNGVTTISNAAEEPEVDDLIEFLNLLGAKVERVEPRVIRVTGTNNFKGAKFRVQPDRNEVVTFIVAALVTNGNINIKGVVKEHLLSFVNILTKMGVQYEFEADRIRVWHTGSPLNPVNVTTAPAPGFMTDWQPLVTLLLTQATGTSLVHDTIYTDRFGYTRDLNRMGAKILLKKPSEVGLDMVISDDMYDVKAFGEPSTIAQIEGPSSLRGVKAAIPDLRAGASLVIAGLGAEGKTVLSGYEHVVRGYENFAQRLNSLGAKVAVLD